MFYKFHLILIISLRAELLCALSNTCTCRIMCLFTFSFRPGAQKLVAATSSNHEIRLYQYADLTMTDKLEGTNYIWFNNMVIISICKSANQVNKYSPAINDFNKTDYTVCIITFRSLRCYNWYSVCTHRGKHAVFICSWPVYQVIQNITTWTKMGIRYI